MSFGKDKPPFRDYRPGRKSSQDIVDDFRKKVDQEFRRAGFPFDREDMLHGYPDLRERMDRWANNRPHLFQDPRHFFYDDVDSEHPNGWNSGQSSSSAQHDIPVQKEHPKSEPQPAAQAQEPEQAERGIQHHGLRNTVDIGQAQQAQQQQSPEERAKRAQSAPPDNPSKEPQRFVSKLDFTPGSQEPAQPEQPQPQQQASQPPQSKPSNVRHIPIFVEGRDEPVVSKHDVGSTTSSAHSDFSHPHIHEDMRFGDSPSKFTSSLHHNFQPYRQKRAEPQANKRPFPQQHTQVPPQHTQVPPQQTQAAPQQKAAPPQQKAAPQPQTPPPQPKQPPKPLDALEKVAQVQTEVEDLAKQIEAFQGQRQDKQYIYLDEMLTRNLIKLDVIETEGRDDVRTARKETIRLIQKCISLLESKAVVPADNSNPQPMDTSEPKTEEEVVETDKSMETESSLPEQVTCSEQLVESNSASAPVEEKPAESEVVTSSTNSSSEQEPSIKSSSEAPSEATVSSTEPPAPVPQVPTADAEVSSSSEPSQPTNPTQTEVPVPTSSDTEMANSSEASVKS